jgi:hypothetical protein
MRLVLTRASSHYVNLDECLYKCDCGEEAEYIVGARNRRLTALVHSGCVDQ